MVEVGNPVGGESLLGTIKIAVLPIAKVFTVCSLGLLMASKYVNILPAHGRKLLNGVRPKFRFSFVFQTAFWNYVVPTNEFPTFSLAAGFLTFASMFDILSTRTSHHLGENARVVRVSSVVFS